MSHCIVRDDVTEPGGAFTRWIDPRTGNTYLVQGTGPDRQISWGSSYLVNNVLHWRTIEADYSSHTWFDQVIHAAGPIQGTPPADPYGGFGGTPAQVEAWLASGLYKITGHGKVNGHEATGLKAPWAKGYRELWVGCCGIAWPSRIVRRDLIRLNSNMPIAQSASFPACRSRSRPR